MIKKKGFIHEDKNKVRRPNTRKLRKFPEGTTNGALQKSRGISSAVTQGSITQAARQGLPQHRGPEDERREAQSLPPAPSHAFPCLGEPDLALVKLSSRWTETGRASFQACLGCSAQYNCENHEDEGKEKALWLIMSVLTLRNRGRLAEVIIL